MAIVMRGRYKGASIELYQFCNNWATDEWSRVFSIGSLEFRDDELQRINRAEKLHQCGLMMQMFEWKGNRLVKRKHE